MQRLIIQLGAICQDTQLTGRRAPSRKGLKPKALVMLVKTRDMHRFSCYSANKFYRVSFRKWRLQDLNCGHSRYTVGCWFFCCHWKREKSFVWLRICLLQSKRVLIFLFVKIITPFVVSFCKTGCYRTSGCVSEGKGRMLCLLTLCVCKRAGQLQSPLWKKIVILFTFSETVNCLLETVCI